MATFVSEIYEHHVQVIPNKNEDSIWVKIKKEHCEEAEDIYLGTFYVSPEKSGKETERDFFSSFNEEINTFKSKGIVYLGSSRKKIP